MESSEPSISSSSNLDQSPKISLFAGIKPKSKTEVPKKVKKDTKSEQKTSSDKLLNVVSDRSLEQLVAKKLDLKEQEIDPAIDVGQAKHSQEMNEGTNEFDERLVSREDDFSDLLISTGNDSVQEGLQPKSVEDSPLTKEGNVLVDLGNTVPIVEGNSQIASEHNAVSFGLDLEATKDGSFAKKDSLLDAEIGIDDSDRLVEESSLTGKRESGCRKDHDSVELCIDSNMRLVTVSVLNQSELVMVIKLTNHNQSRVAVEGISLKIEPPSNLVADSSSTEVAVEKLSFLETVSVISFIDFCESYICISKYRSQPGNSVML